MILLEHAACIDLTESTSGTTAAAPDLRITHLGVHNGSLFGLSYDQGQFFCYKGETDWEALGPVPETTQV